MLHESLGDDLPNLIESYLNIPGVIIAYEVVNMLVSTVKVALVTAKVAVEIHWLVFNLQLILPEYDCLGVVAYRWPL